MIGWKNVLYFWGYVFFRVFLLHHHIPHIDYRITRKFFQIYSLNLTKRLLINNDFRLIFMKVSILYPTHEINKKYLLKRSQAKNPNDCIIVFQKHFIFEKYWFRDVTKKHENRLPVTFDKTSVNVQTHNILLIYNCQTEYNYISFVVFALFVHDLIFTSN